MGAAGGDVSRARAEHSVVMYGLSTCVWCKKMRQFLESEGVTFDVIYVDELQGAERESAIETVRRWNPAASFPVTVVDDERSVNGYKPDEAREVLGL